MMTVPAPAGWHLECPQCHWTDGVHAPGCESVAIPRLDTVTSPPAPQPAPAIPLVTPQPGSRLEQLLALRESAEAALEEAKDRLLAIKAGIYADAAALAVSDYGISPAALPEAIDIAGDATRPALRMRWREGDLYVAAEDLRAKAPDVWDSLKKRKRGGWRLNELGSRS
jgi:hypothetical protein